MSRIEELIAELCPNGVEYADIGSLISRIREKAKSNKHITQVYVVSNTMGMVKAEEYRENTIHSEDTSNYTIVRKDMFAYNPSRLNIGSIAMQKDESGLVSPMYVVFEVDKNRIDVNYLNYLIHSTFVITKINSYKEEGARFRFDFERWKWIKIPLPPLDIQNEVVKILDTFSDYIGALEAELTARKKQYEYYRDMLLDFGVHRGGTSECE